MTRPPCDRQDPDQDAPRPDPGRARPRGRRATLLRRHRHPRHGGHGCAPAGVVEGRRGRSAGSRRRGRRPGALRAEDKAEVEVHGEVYVVMRERDVHAVAAERVGDEATGLYLSRSRHWPGRRELSRARAVPAGCHCSAERTQLLAEVADVVRGGSGARPRSTGRRWPCRRRRGTPSRSRRGCRARRVEPVRPAAVGRVVAEADAGVRRELRMPARRLELP